MLRDWVGKDQILLCVSLPLSNNERDRARKPGFWTLHIVVRFCFLAGSVLSQFHSLHHTSRLPLCSSICTCVDVGTFFSHHLVTKQINTGSYSSWHWLQPLKEHYRSKAQTTPEPKVWIDGEYLCKHQERLHQANVKSQNGCTRILPRPSPAQYCHSDRDFRISICVANSLSSKA